MKKISILGKGTAGSLAYVKALALRNSTESQFGHLEIEWYYDSSTKAMAVGEGTTPAFPKTLATIDGLSMGTDMHKLDARHKIGIEYENLGKSDFVHPFGVGSHGIHFNASKFQNYVFHSFSIYQRCSSAFLISNDVD